METSFTLPVTQAILFCDEKESTIRELVQKIPNTSDPIALARSLGALSLQYLPDKITIAKLTIPVIDIEIPLEIDVKKVFGGI